MQFNNSIDFASTRGLIERNCLSFLSKEGKVSFVSTLARSGNNLHGQIRHLIKEAFHERNWGDICCVDQ